MNGYPEWMARERRALLMQLAAILVAEVAVAMFVSGRSMMPRPMPRGVR